MDQNQDRQLIKVAEDAVRNYQSANRDREFSYDCTSNPEGISDEQLFRDVTIFENEMFFALVALKDEDIQLVLQQTQDRDHDGSSFKSTSLEHVQRWRADNVDVVTAIDSLSLETALAVLRKASLSPMYVDSYVEGHREQLRTVYFAGELSSEFVQAEITATTVQRKPADSEISCENNTDEATVRTRMRP